MVRRAHALCAVLLVAGPAWAGDAWVAHYRYQGAHGHCELTVVRDDTRAEYRGCGQPMRRWQQLGDGIELLELDPRQDAVVRHSPGDLRAIGREPEWDRVAGIAPARLRAILPSSGTGQAHGWASTQYRGQDADGRTVDLEWLEQPALPARYRIGGSADGESFELERLQRLPAAEAFTALQDLREIDIADAGD